jgi:chromosome segregation ATPase
VSKAEAAERTAIQQHRVAASRLGEAERDIQELTEANQVYVQDIRTYRGRVTELETDLGQAVMRADRLDSDFRELERMHRDTQQQFAQASRLHVEQIDAAESRAAEAERRAGMLEEMLEERAVAAERLVETAQRRAETAEDAIHERDRRINDLEGEMWLYRGQVTQRNQQLQIVLDQLIRLGAVTPWQDRRVPQKLRDMRGDLTRTLRELGDVADQALERAARIPDDDLKRFVAEERRLRQLPQRPG